MGASDSPPTKRKFEREARRFSCEFRTQGENYRGFVHDLSARGLFLQTVAVPPEGSEVRLKLYDPQEQPIELVARVARLRSSHRSLSALETGGIGLRIESAPEAYFQLVLDLGRASAR